MHNRRKQEIHNTFAVNLLYRSLRNLILILSILVREYGKFYISSPKERFAIVIYAIIFWFLLGRASECVIIKNWGKNKNKKKNKGRYQFTQPSHNANDKFNDNANNPNPDFDINNPFFNIDDPPNNNNNENDKNDTYDDDSLSDTELNVTRELNPSNNKSSGKSVKNNVYLIITLILLII